MKSEINLKIKEKKVEKQSSAQKSVKTLAHSIYQTLRDEGCENKDIIGISSQLIGLVTSAMDRDDK